MATPTPWIRIPGLRLSRLCQAKAAGGQGFTWQKGWRHSPAGRETNVEGLELVSPNGTVFEFRLRGGCWLRRKPEK